MKPRYEVANILQRYGRRFRAGQRLPAHHLRTLGALEQCRTAALGGHADACTGCGYIRIAYNSCRNRHCPKCQNTNRERWLMEREADLLPVPYFHVVFTLPHELNGLCMLHPKKMYGMLFKAAWQTVEGFGWNPKFLGGETGMTAVLHTWGQNISLHPHLHCIVPGGGLSVSGKWIPAKNKGKYLFPVKRKGMSQVFRAKYMALLRGRATKEAVKIEKAVYDKCFEKDWVVYAKRAFHGPQGVMEYLGRYSHKIAISNHRLTDIDGGKVRFKWKDYRTLKNSEMELGANEFLRRFCLHILPKGFPRIRHYGMLASRHKADRLAMVRKQLSATTPAIKEKRTWQYLAKERLGFDVAKCPECGGQMVGVEELLPNSRQNVAMRGPPPLRKLLYNEWN
jgi:hypothetical protein